MTSQTHSRAISIIIPVLDEAAVIESALLSLQSLRYEGHEIIVVDGGSVDDSVRLAGAYADQVLTSERGRARQMNAGAAEAGNDILLFLHADTLLPASAANDITKAMAVSSWGRFDVCIEPRDWLLNLVAYGMNLRSRLTGIATGDQAIFVRRDVFALVGGYPEIDLMEDIALSDLLKRMQRPICLRARVSTSARRWHKHGRLRTILKMWRLRLAYRLGVNPEQLARDY